MTVRDDRIITLGDGVVMGGTPGISRYLLIACACIRVVYPLICKFPFQDLFSGCQYSLGYILIGVKVGNSNCQN